MAILTRYRSWRETYRFCGRFRAGRNDRYKKDTGIILYNTSNYVFNFTAEADRKDLKEMMEEKAEQTYFIENIPDKYVYVPNECYEK